MNSAPFDATVAYDAPLSSEGLSKRSLLFPVRVRSPRHAAAVIRVARALADGRVDAAAAVLRDLRHLPALSEVDGDGPCVSPTLRAQALAGILFDLGTSGWRVAVEEGQIYLSCPPQADDGGAALDLVAAKARVRRQMAARVQDQLGRPETRRFIARCECPRYVRVGGRNVLSLLAHGPTLAEALRARGAGAVQPYVQRALSEDGRDQTTGLRLCDVFRYFRYFWSFPVGSAPGRTIPFLVRDAGQPGHPVCGLLAIASPVPKLAVRDAALGWTPAWLEAVVGALVGLDYDNAAENLRSIESQVRDGDDTADVRSVFSAVGTLLGLEGCADAESIAARVRRLTAAERRARAARARSRLLRDLRAEVQAALGEVSLSGLGLTQARALASPTNAIERLERLRGKSLEEWKVSRALTGSHPRRTRGDERNAPRAASREPLFVKKRVVQAVALLTAWAELAPRERERASERLTELVLKEPSGAPKLTGGAHVARGVRCALLQRQTRFVASQVADVSICGALPPYGPLLGGKLAALLALSREVAATYHKRYSGRASVITSQMAGRAVERPADLVALTTTSFYAAGSAQYERLRLPDELGGVRWRFVGLSRGHGTLHFSRETTESVQSLVELETGRRLVSGRFGEGPSERLRKLRDGLGHLGLDGSEFVQHGMARRAYVAELQPGATPPGGAPGGRAWRLAGARADQVIAHWRSRWLAPRLARMPAILADVEAFDREEALLGARLGSGLDATKSEAV